MAKRITNQFERTYGFHINDFAAAESVTPEAIRMRIKNFGSIYQRRKIPTKYERMYGRTLFEIAEERNLHPVTIESHQKKYKDAYHSNPDRPWHTRPETPLWREAVQEGRYWRLQCPWLHPSHPDYDAYRSGEMYPDDYIGGSDMDPADVEAMMHKFNWKKYSGSIK